MSPVTAPSPDIEYCYEAVQGVSRTFALTVDSLAEPMASHIGLGYLLCRVADTVEDAGHIPPDEQVRLLRTYDAALNPDDECSIDEFRSEVEQYLPPEDERSDEWEVVGRSPTVWATFLDQSSEVQDAIIPPVREMVDGMANFLEQYADHGGLRLQTYEELEEYCYYAAGTVGILITNLLTQRDIGAERTQRLYEKAESFALLLQLVNIAKDVHDDFVEENNVYLPGEWLLEEDVDQEEVLEPGNTDSVVRVVRRTASRARTFLDDAQTYLETMPLVDGNTLSAWSVPYLLSVGTLREIENRPSDALTPDGVKINREEVLAVMNAAMNSGAESLEELRETIDHEPFHEAIE